MQGTAAGGAEQPPPGGTHGPGRVRAVVPAANKALQLVVSQLASLAAQGTEGTQGVPCVRFLLSTRPDAVYGRVLPALRQTFSKCGGLLEVRCWAVASVWH